MSQSFLLFVPVFTRRPAQSKCAGKHICRLPKIDLYSFAEKQQEEEFNHPADFRTYLFAKVFKRAVSEAAAKLGIAKR